ncbi:MAG TPA: hypothetical protein VJB65_00495 [Patescibacteria group bacterium]|nr:hypothetical protein [Patescibacteria group bacterium]
MCYHQNRKKNKKIVPILFGISFFLPLQTLAVDLIDGSKAGSATGLGTSSPTAIAMVIIGAFLGVLGIIAVSLILYAGFKWMTAAGNQEQVKKAQEMLKNAVIGLLIILASYGIALYIFSILETATGFQ